MSVRISDPGLVSEGSVFPASITSIIGQGFGFLLQNNKKSKARSAGRIAKFVCTCPRAIPDVGDTSRSLRINDRKAEGDSGKSWGIFLRDFEFISISLT